MQYKVVRSSKLTQLIDDVNLNILKGYVPLGGVCCMNYSETHTDEYIQAMIKEDK